MDTKSKSVGQLYLRIAATLVAIIPFSLLALILPFINWGDSEAVGWAIALLAVLFGIPCLFLVPLVSWLLSRYSQDLSVIQKKALLAMLTITLLSAVITFICLVVVGTVVGEVGAALIGGIMYLSGAITLISLVTQLIFLLVLIPRLWGWKNSKAISA